MKIIDRAAFLKAPANTIYAEGGRWNFDSWNIKVENIGDNDWYYDTLDWGAIDCTGSDDMILKLEDCLGNGSSYPMNFFQTARNGYYNADGLYAILEADDIRKLVTRLQACLPFIEQLITENPVFDDLDTSDP